MSNCCPLDPPPQLELVLENGSVDPERILDDTGERFWLNQVQRQKVQSYVLERGAAYLDEKLAVVAQEHERIARKRFWPGCGTIGDLRSRSRSRRGQKREQQIQERSLQRRQKKR